MRRLAGFFKPFLRAIRESGTGKYLRRQLNGLARERQASRRRRRRKALDSLLNRPGWSTRWLNGTRTLAGLGRARLLRAVTSVWQWLQVCVQTCKRFIHNAIAATRVRVVQWLYQLAAYFTALFVRLRALKLRSRIRARLAVWRERRRGPFPGDNSFVYQPRRHPGSRARYYVVHIPSDYSGRRPCPLVMVLHGCRQDHRDIETISNFNRLAESQGFFVVYPFVTSYRGIRIRNCWGCWKEREIHRGAGEVEDLWQIIEEVRQRYKVYSRRIHVIGLSSGAGMAVAMMVAHCDRIASGAAVAGIPYAEVAEAVSGLPGVLPRNRPVEAIVSAMNREMGNRERLVPIQIIHSYDDETVGIRAAQNLRDSWGRCFGIDTDSPHSVRTGTTSGTAWEHTKYRSVDGSPAIETLFLRGPGHGWYGGNAGRYSHPDAPDITRASWRFFKTHPMSAEYGVPEPNDEQRKVAN